MLYDADVLKQDFNSEYNEYNAARDGSAFFIFYAEHVADLYAGG